MLLGCKKKKKKHCLMSQAIWQVWRGWLVFVASHGPPTRYINLRVVYARECLERFPCHRHQRKALVSMLVTHVPWCMSGSLTRGGRENVPGFSGTCATRNFAYLVRGPFMRMSCFDAFRRNDYWSNRQQDNVMGIRFNLIRQTSCRHRAW